MELRAQLGKATDQILRLQDIMTGQAVQLAEGRAAQMLLEASESRLSELEAKVEHGSQELENARIEANRAVLEAQEAQKRGEAAEEALHRINQRGFWSRLTNKKV